MPQCQWSRGMVCPLSGPQHIGCYCSFLLTC
jgi:hypothetical protein